MVSAVHYFATRADQEELLAILGEPGPVELRPWPLLSTGVIALDWDTALATEQVMVTCPALGMPVGVRAGDPSTIGGSRSAVFNRMNLDRLRPEESRSLLVDSNASPVLLWTPGRSSDPGVLVASAIGSQADSPAAISADYARWVGRVVSWVRRKGTKVWGLEGGRTAPELDIQLRHISSVYALPEAMEALRRGVTGR